MCGLCVCVCRPVCQKKDSHSKVLCVCVWEKGGALFHGGKLLSCSFGSSAICISCHPPFSFFFSPAAWEAEQRPPDPRVQRKSAKTQPKAEGCLQAQHWSTDMAAVLCKLCCVTVPCMSVIEVERSLLVIRNLLWFTSIKIGTHLEGKPRWNRCGKATAQRAVGLRGEKKQNEKMKWINKGKLWKSAELF